MLKSRPLIVSCLLLAIVAACGGGNSDGKDDEGSLDTSSVTSVSVQADDPVTTEEITPMTWLAALKQSFGVEMFVDADERSSSLLAAGLLPMVGPLGNPRLFDRAELCAGLPLSVYMPLQSGKYIELAYYESVGLSESPEDKYTQDVVVSLIYGLSEEDYMGDLTKIRSALNDKLRCETNFFPDNAVPSENTYGTWAQGGAWTIGVDTGSNPLKMTRVFAFRNNDLICTTKADSLGTAVATTQVAIGTLDTVDFSLQYGGATFIYYMPTFELAVVVNTKVMKDQFYGTIGDAKEAHDLAIALADEFGYSTVSKICAAASATKAAHDGGMESEYKPTPLPLSNVSYGGNEAASGSTGSTSGSQSGADDNGAVVNDGAGSESGGGGLEDDDAAVVEEDYSSDVDDDAAVVEEDYSSDVDDDAAVVEED